MSAYGSSDVARLLGLSVGQVRAWVKAGFLDPSRGPRGELRFSFGDLVLLRTAKGLVSARIPERRVRAALRDLKARLPEGRELRDVRVRAEGDRIVVQDGGAAWQADSGQTLFDFESRDLARKVAPLQRRATTGTALDWYERGCDLEESDPGEARASYERAVGLDPALAEAHINLGRLLHEAGEAQRAVEHYRAALGAAPANAVATFNLAVALEDLSRFEEAVLAYSQALALDPRLADAHFNLAHLYEKRGDGRAALRHLSSYRALVRA